MQVQIVNNAEDMVFLRLGSRRSSDEGPSWMQKRPGSAAVERRTGQLSPSPTATSSKESLWLSAISKENTRPIPVPLSIARGAVHVCMTFAYTDLVHF